MEKIGHWRVYRPEDGIYGTATTSNLTTARLTSVEENLITGTVTIPKPSEPKELKPFHCPCCGGNSYKTMNGKTVCEYCDTEFIR